MAICLPRYEVSRVTEEGRRLADALRQIRAERKLTQSQVANAWGMSVDGYRPYEAGRRQLRTSALPGLATALGVSISDLSTRLGLHGARAQELRIAECTDLMGQLEGEPPEVVETVLRWWRDSIQIAKLHERAREN